MGGEMRSEIYLICYASTTFYKRAGTHVHTTHIRIAYEPRSP